MRVLTFILDLAAIGADLRPLYKSGENREYLLEAAVSSSHVKTVKLVVERDREMVAFYSSLECFRSDE